MKEKLKTHINSIHPVPEEVLDDFLTYWHPLRAGKKEVISRFNKTDRYLYFSLEGIQKAYYVADGREYIVAFTSPFSFTCVPESFLTQEPSKYYFQCITESQFYRIYHTDFFRFVENHHEIETFLRKALINLVGGVTERYHRLLTCSIEARYRDFMKNSSHLLTQIPHKDVANYLNMDPTNFSKLMNLVKV